WLVAGLLVLRDAGMIVGAAYFHLRGKRAVPKANRWGKATTCCYYLTISAVMLAWPGPGVALGLLWFTVALSYVTTWIYVAGMDLIDTRRRVL
ncbi:MAG: CDP-diacylglycerol--glycerol-3-phosphate 3-phosphatidyltransferase, partial [Alicyclobacillus sp.]|nr:CDP-diacylglycerol--glycerol-3-phosphate 3-phosphatidyltransferase [Alicyclobacillus sp.]